ncbi:MAG: LuxR C-terminal-related transcriptional regulator [Chloroflexota bacterium]
MTEQHPALTARQRDVLRLVAQGRANKEIAATLGVSTRAVEAALTRMYERLGVPNRAALIAVTLSEAGFGLPIARRNSPLSAVGAVAAPASLEAEARAYATAPFMVAVTEGPSHRYSFVNRISAEAAGRIAESFIGRTVVEVYPDIDNRFLAGLDGAYSTGRPWSTGAPLPIRWTHEDGSVRDATVNIMFQPLRDVAGTVVGLLHIGAEESEPA